MTEEEIKEIKADADIVDVVSRFTALKRNGGNYVGLCPFHKDENVGSFKVNPHKGIYKCYSCGEGGDVLDFLIKTGKTFKESVSILKGEAELEGSVLEKSTRTKVQLAVFEYIKPLEDVNPNNFVHKKYGKPAKTYTYFSHDHTLAGYLLRYQDKNGEKVILPYNYGVCVEDGWEYEYMDKGRGKYYKVGDVVHRFLGFGEQRPIYGAEKVLENPKANITISEGEKCADFIQERYSRKQVVSLCWQGGSNTANQVDWSLLDGRRVFLLPDNDEPSNVCFQFLAEELKRYNCEIILVIPPEDAPEGWDVADSNFTRDELSVYIRGNGIAI